MSPAILNPSPTKDRDSVGDERRTPRWLYEACSASWGPFHLDGAATADNHLCEDWLGPGSRISENALRTPPGELSIAQFVTPRMWLNPPYGRGKIAPFMEWAAENARMGWTVCCLIILDPSLPWWVKNIGDPFRPHPWIGEIKVVQKTPNSINGRVRFEHPSIAKPLGANFPSCVVVMRPPFL